MAIGPAPSETHSPSDLENALSDSFHRCRMQGDIDTWAQRFRALGYVNLTALLPASLRFAVREEGRSIVARGGTRVDFRMPESGNSPRHLTTFGPSDICENGRLIPHLYESPVLRELLSRIAATDILRCPWEPEKFIVNRTHREGDTHGWHWGDYEYALIWVLVAPPLSEGGMLQCIPDTIWDKQNPRVHEYLCERPIRTYHHDEGDVYLLKTDTTLHRTVPLNSDSERVILNFCYASPAHADREVSHETMNAMYHHPEIHHTPRLARRFEE